MTSEKCFHSASVLVDTRSRLSPRSVCEISRLFYVKLCMTTASLLLVAIQPLVCSQQRAVLSLTTASLLLDDNRCGHLSASRSTTGLTMNSQGTTCCTQLFTHVTVVMIVGSARL